MGNLRIIGIKEIMAMTGMGRPAVTRMLETKGCPILPRHKHESYRIEEGQFLLWFNNVYVKGKK